MRTILVVRNNPACEAILRHEFKEETTTGKTKLIFIYPEELFDVWTTRGEECFCVKSPYRKIRIFVITPNCASHILSQPILTALRLQFKKRIVIAIILDKGPTTIPTDNHHKPDLACFVGDLKTKLDEQFGWVGLHD